MKCLNLKISTQLVSYKCRDPSSTSTWQVDRVTTFGNVRISVVCGFLFQNLAEVQEGTLFPLCIIAQQTIQHPRAEVLNLPKAAVV